MKNVPFKVIPSTNVSSIIGMLPEMNFVKPRSFLIAFSQISSMVWKRPFKGVLSLGNKKKNLLGLCPENAADEAQRLSDVVPVNCGLRTTCKPKYCRGEISKSGLSAIQAISCATIPPTSLNFLVQLFIYHLTTWLNSQ